MNIISISAFNDEPGVVLLKDNRIVSFCSEKWLIKQYENQFPINSLNFCLQKGDLTIHDIDGVVCFEKPYSRFEKVITGFLKSFPFNFNGFYRDIPLWLEKRLSFSYLIEKYTDYRGEILYLNNDLANAASSYFLAKQKPSNSIVCGRHHEWSGLSRFACSGSSFKLIDRVTYPNALLDLIYAFTAFLGIRKMRLESFEGLVQYGKNDLEEQLSRIIDIKQDGSFRICEKYFDFQITHAPFTPHFVKLFGPPLSHPSECEQKHYDMIYSLDIRIKQILMSAADDLFKKSNNKSLCLSGDLFKNSNLTSSLMASSKYDMIQPDTFKKEVSALAGAAFFTNSIIKNIPVETSASLLNDARGPEFNSKKVKRFLSSRMIDFNELSDSKIISFLDEKIDAESVIGLCRGNFSIFSCHSSDPVVISSKASAARDKLCEFRDANFSYKALLSIMVLESDLKEVFTLESEFSECLSRFPESSVVSSNLRTGFIEANNLKGLENHKFKIMVIRASENELLHSLLQLRKKKENIPVLFTSPLYFNTEQSFDIAQFYNDFLDSELTSLVIENYVIEK